MIRINLLGQAPPKARRRAAVPAGAAAQMILVVFVLVATLAGWGLFYWFLSDDVEKLRQDVNALNLRKQELEKLKQDVERHRQNREVLQRRIAVIEELQRNRTGGQELLDMLATTVTRTEALWLTSVIRKGDSLTIEGTAASINAVANFITQLKRSGYFEKVEIKESRQDEKSVGVQTFLFTLTADFVLPQSKTPAAAPAKS